MLRSISVRFLQTRLFCVPLIAFLRISRVEKSSMIESISNSVEGDQAHSFLSINMFIKHFEASTLWKLTVLSKFENLNLTSRWPLQNALAKVNRMVLFCTNTGFGKYDEIVQRTWKLWMIKNWNDLLLRLSSEIYLY